MTRIVTVRGTGESYGPHSMCGGVVSGLPTVVELDYRAEIRPIGLLRLPESAALGRAALRAQDGLGLPWVAVGFSLGAMILGDYVMLDRPKNLRGVVLLADPLRHRDQCAHGGVPRNHFGIAGERFVSGVPAHSFAIPDDPIASCPSDNGMRLISNQVASRAQPIPLRCVWDAGFTIQWVWKYAVDGRHVAYGSERVPGSQHTFVEAARSVVEGML